MPLLATHSVGQFIDYVGAMRDEKKGEENAKSLLFFGGGVVRF